MELAKRCENPCAPVFSRRFALDFVPRACSRQVHAPDAPMFCRPTRLAAARPRIRLQQVLAGVERSLAQLLPIPFLRASPEAADSRGAALRESCPWCPGES